MGAKIITAVLTSAFLSEDTKLRRLPRAPKRSRPQKFWDGFEDRALVYDVFWHMDGTRVLMVCPPAVNLETHWAEARFKAQPSGKLVNANFHSIRSTMTIALNEVPADSTHIELSFAGQVFNLQIRDNLANEFDGSRVIFTMSQNNPLSWIDEWARYHQTIHGADAVIIFDNGSTLYDPQEMAKSVAQVPGIQKVLVVSLPHKYGPHDPGVILNRFWANFLQVSSFSILLRRFAGRAFGLLNVDIDELAAPIPNSDAFEITHKSIDGFCALQGKWVESIVEPDISHHEPTHVAYRSVLRDFRHRLNAKKWVLDPNRDWVKNLNIHPSPHRIKNMPKPMAKRATRGKFWHFKGINNNWKENRRYLTTVRPFMHHAHPELKAMFDRYFEKITDADQGDTKN